MSIARDHPLSAFTHHPSFDLFCHHREQRCNHRLLLRSKMKTEPYRNRGFFTQNRTEIDRPRQMWNRNNTIRMFNRLLKFWRKIPNRLGKNAIKHQGKFFWLTLYVPLTEGQDELCYRAYISTTYFEEHLFINKLFQWHQLLIVTACNNNCSFMYTT